MGVNIDIRELRELQANIQRLSVDDFCEAAAKELAGRLLRKVKQRTPVGVYPNRVGGTLRRGWTIDADIQKRGNTYVVEIVNPTEYASYVEYGHRTANGSGWVEGRFMLTLSEKELQQSADAIVERKLENWLRGVFR